MIDASFVPIISQLHTSDDAAIMIDRLEEMKKSIFLIDHNDFLYNIRQHFSERLANAIEESLGIRGVNSHNRDDLMKFFENLIEVIKSCPVIHMTIAKEVKGTTLSSVAESLKESFGKEVLVETIIDPSIIAGAIIVYKGLYLDESIKNKLEKYFANHTI